MQTYKIIRFFLNGNNQVIKRGLSLKEAQKHCRNPETSSKSATTDQAKQRTEQMGPWFDGYDVDE